MLLLTLKGGQEIVINGRIRVTILAVGGDRVRVGRSDPPEVRVDRAEARQHLAGAAGRR